MNAVIPALIRFLIESSEKKKCILWFFRRGLEIIARIERWPEKGAKLHPRSIPAETKYQKRDYCQKPELQSKAASLPVHRENLRDEFRVLALGESDTSL